MLANEEVIDGRSEVGDFPVEKKPMRQWVLKITEYAEKLLEDLDSLDWPESTKEMQRNWIGKSVGANVTFKVQSSEHSFTCFTTRPDTLFGATFCVLAPEHPLVAQITTNDQKDSVEDYIAQSASKSDMSRMLADREKTGVHTGAYAINPVNNQPIPIFIADYVLMSYGSGAIMAVPGHDERDHQFAKKYNLKIQRVITGGPCEDIEEQAHPGDGTLVNSQLLDGLNTSEAFEKMIQWLEENKLGSKQTTYKLRDWIFSRQRYWGEPFPLARDNQGNVVAIDEKDLPVTLPEIDEYKPSPDGEPPLSRAKDWLEVDIGGKTYTRETNIMPQWAGSCWYYLRYLDPQNDKAFCAPEKEKYWMPVDLYVGGVEHANLHLLYARFWHKVLYDIGVVSTKEPFKKVVHPGLVLGSNGEKMSKSRGNVVNPDDIIEKWGADSLRLFEMFLGPIDQVKPWQEKNSIAGVHRFLKRVWRLVIDENGNISSKISDKDDSITFTKALHKTIKKLTVDTEEMKFNTGIAALMELVNQAYKETWINTDSVKDLLKLLAPYAPHICEELWQRLGQKDMISFSPWPSFNPEYTVEDMLIIPIMVNGRKRATIEVAKSMDQKQVLDLAKKQDSVIRHLSDKKLVKEIYVNGKIVNLVVK